MRSGRMWVVAGVAIAAVLLWLSLRGIEWRQVGSLLAHASPGWLTFATLLAVVSLFLRAVRWRVLLNAEGNVSVMTAFWATNAGYFGNNFLPARGGELVRTFAISANSNLTPAFVLATALSERIADAIALVVAGSAVLLTLPIEAGWLAGAIRAFAVAGLAGAAAIAVLPLLGGRLTVLVNRLPVRGEWRSKVGIALGHALTGMRTFHDARRLAAFSVLTVVVWFLDAVGTAAVATALALSMTLKVAFLLLAALGLASALPSTPGFVGIYQFVAVTVLAPFGVSRNDALAFILLTQAARYLVIGVLGAIGLKVCRPLRST